jgi:hypothetical protein
MVTREQYGILLNFDDSKTEDSTRSDVQIINNSCSIKDTEKESSTLPVTLSKDIFEGILIQLFNILKMNKII